MKRLDNLSHLLFREVSITKHLQPVLTNGNRSLQLMRSISDEPLLLFKQLAVSLGIPVDRFIQHSELRHRRRVINRFSMLIDVIPVQPTQQAVKRPHGTRNHPSIHDDNGKHYGQIQAQHPISDRLQQVLLLDGRRYHRQLHPLTFTILENRTHHTSRFRLLLSLNIQRFIRVRKMRMTKRILLTNLRQMETIVCTVVNRRQILTSQVAGYYHLCIQINGIIHLISDFINHSHIEKHRPHRKHHYQKSRNTANNAILQFHTNLYPNPYTVLISTSAPAAASLRLTFFNWA